MAWVGEAASVWCTFGVGAQWWVVLWLRRSRGLGAVSVAQEPPVLVSQECRTGGGHKHGGPEPGAPVQLRWVTRCQQVTPCHWQL